MDAKKCARCGESKPATAFYRHAGWLDGMHPYCKLCLLAYQKERREAYLVQHPGAFRWKRDRIKHAYFSSIDSPIKAYVLGLLAADGNVLAKQSRITLELSAKDAVMLCHVRDELAPGTSTTHRIRHDREYHILAFVSHQMVTDLNSFGVVPEKSLTMEWPERLPDEFAREFILGYFDGDGSVTYEKRLNKRYPRWGIVSGSSRLLASIADAIEQGAGVRPGGPWKRASTNCYAIRAAGTDAVAIDIWLHDSGLGLVRKRVIC